MPGDDYQDQVEQEIYAIENRRYLLGFLPEFQAKNVLWESYKVRNPIGPGMEPNEIENLKDEKFQEFEERWRGANQAIDADCPGFLKGQVDWGYLPEDDEIQRYIEGFEDQDHFKKMTSDMRDDSWYYALIPIKPIVAAQPSVTTTAYTDIPTRDEDGLLEVIKYCLPIRGNKYLMTNRFRDEQSATYQIVSRGPNMHIAADELRRDEETDAIKIEFTLKPTINILHIKELNDRFLLHNGYHRCFRLLQEGETHVPAFVHKPTSLDETLVESTWTFNKSQVLSPRPPMIDDLTSDAAVDIDHPAQNKMFRVRAESMNVRR